MVVMGPERNKRVWEDWLTEVINFSEEKKIQDWLVPKKTQLFSHDNLDQLHRIPLKDQQTVAKTKTFSITMQGLNSKDPFFHWIITMMMMVHWSLVTTQEVYLSLEPGLESTTGNIVTSSSLQLLFKTWHFPWRKFFWKPPKFNQSWEQ